MQLVYEVQSVNYTGPITLLSLLRGGEDADQWYSLMNHVGDDCCWRWMQLQPMNVHLCCAMSCQLRKNDKQVLQRPIKIDKQDVIGYSITQRIRPGDKLTLCKKVAVVDSNDYAKDHLIDHAIRCLTSL